MDLMLLGMDQRMAKRLIKISLLATAAAFVGFIIFASAVTYIIKTQPDMVHEKLKDQLGINFSYVDINVFWAWYGPRIDLGKTRFFSENFSAQIEVAEVGINAWKTLMQGGSIALESVSVVRAKIHYQSPPIDTNAPKQESEINLIKTIRETAEGANLKNISLSNISISIDHAFGKDDLQVSSLRLAREPLEWIVEGTVNSPKIATSIKLSASLTPKIVKISATGDGPGLKFVGTGDIAVANDTLSEIGVSAKEISGLAQPIIAVLPDAALPTQAQKWLTTNLKEPRVASGNFNLNWKPQEPVSFSLNLDVLVPSLTMTEEMQDLQNIIANIVITENDLTVNASELVWINKKFDTVQFKIPSFSAEPLVSNARISAQFDLGQFEKLVSELLQKNVTLPNKNTLSINNFSPEVRAHLKITLSGPQVGETLFTAKANLKDTQLGLSRHLFLANLNGDIEVNGNSSTSEKIKLEGSLKGDVSGERVAKEKININFATAPADIMNTIALQISSHNKKEIPKPGWIRVNTKALSGDAQFLRLKNKIDYEAKVEISRLHLSELTDKNTENKKPEPTESIIYRLPIIPVKKIDFKGSNIALGKHQFKSLYFKAALQSNRISLEPLKASLGSTTIACPYFRWSQEQKGSYNLSELKCDMNDNEIGKTLSNLYDVKEGSGGLSSFKFDLNWQSYPWDLEKRSLTGNFEGEVENLKFAGGRGFLFKLIDLLAFRIDGIMNNSLNIKKAQGRWELKNGIATDDGPTKISLGASESEIKGSFDFNKSTLKLRTNSRIQIGRTVGAVALGTINPALAAYYLYQSKDEDQLINLDFINGFSEFAFSMEGPMDKPNIEKVRYSPFSR